MEPTKKTSKYLCPDSAVSTEQRMSRSLTEVFQLMFNLNLVTTSYRSPKQKDFIPAHIMFNHEQATACVSLHISRAAAFLIAERVGIKVTSDSASTVIQDVACEIVNIVGNNLRTFFSENLDMRFDMALATAGEVASVLQPNIAVNLDFQTTPDALISLDFFCSDAQERNTQDSSTETHE